MPLYDYKCERCGEEWEAFQEMEKHESCQCPKCKALGSQVIRPTQVPRFKPFLHTNLPQETWITSRKHFKEECRRQGVESAWLM